MTISSIRPSTRPQPALPPAAPRAESDIDKVEKIASPVVRVTQSLATHSITMSLLLAATGPLAIVAGVASVGLGGWDTYQDLRQRHILKAQQRKGIATVPSRVLTSHGFKVVPTPIGEALQQNRRDIVGNVGRIVKGALVTAAGVTLMPATIFAGFGIGLATALYAHRKQIPQLPGATIHFVHVVADKVHDKLRH
ncbi:MAG: hypothetical protein ACYCW6_09835 [Candidatus Xenobia bacterium]